MLHKLFVAHPASVGESYGRHLGMAGGFGLRLLGAGLACLLHGLLPVLFERTGSRAVARLHADMVTHRRRDGGAEQVRRDGGSEQVHRDGGAEQAPGKTALMEV